MWWDNLFFHIFTIGGGNNNLLRRMQCSLLLHFVNFGVQQVHSCRAQRGRAGVGGARRRTGSTYKIKLKPYSISISIYLNL